MKVFACVGHKSLKILINSHNSHKSLICTDLIMLDLRLHPQIFEKSGEISISMELLQTKDNRVGSKGNEIRSY